MIRLRHLAPQAIRDVEDAAEWLADGRGGLPLARRFASAVVEVTDRIARRPLLGHRRPELLPDPFRFHAVTGFPYLLVYNAERSMPNVLRVLLMSRDLGLLLARFAEDAEGDDPPAGR
jgi:toxin ParE1/3/4